jgi:hypothetical protein
MSFEKIFVDGNLVDVNVSIWTAQKKLMAEDLGLNEKDFKGTIVLGSKKLIPADVISTLRTLESRARNKLIDYSFKFGFGGARFIPKKKMVQFCDEMDNLIADFDSEADKLEKNYGKYKRVMRKEYVRLAKTAFSRMSKLKRVSKDLTEDTYVDEFLARIEECYPKARDIRSKFHMGYTVFQVALPDLSQANMDDIIEDNEKIKIMEETYRDKIQEQVKSFIHETTGELRGKAEKLLQKFHDNLITDKRINEATMTSIRNMVTNYEEMNFVGDNEFASMLREFQTKWIDCNKAADILKDKKLKKEIINQLKSILKHACDKNAIDGLVKEYKEKLSL